MTCRLLFCCVGFLSVSRLQAHPEIEVALAQLNPAIARRPDDADLLLRRAAAYERHEDLVLAEADLRHAVELTPSSVDAPLRLAGFLITHDRWIEARSPLARVIELDPNQAEGLVWRARLHRQLAETEAANTDYTRALGLLPQPPPELFLERATLPLAPEKILTGLDEGLARLGSVVVLSDRAIALELQLGRPDAALARIDALMSGAERKETWLKRRGDILATAGRAAPARTAYLSALSEIQRLPAWLRESTDSLRLVADLQHLLQPPR